MVQLTKSRLQKGMPTKLQMKRVGPCKILAKYGANAYEIDLPSDFCISPILNVQDLVEFKATLPQNSQGVSTDLEPVVVPQTSKLEVEQVLDTKVKKEKRHQVCMEHLIKSKGKLESVETWVAEANFKKANIPQDLLSPGVT